LICLESGPAGGVFLKVPPEYRRAVDARRFHFFTIIGKWGVNGLFFFSSLIEIVVMLR
jgi:hypothetical protein